MFDVSRDLSRDRVRVVFLGLLCADQETEFSLFRADTYRVVVLCVVSCTLI